MSLSEIIISAWQGVQSGNTRCCFVRDPNNELLHWGSETCLSLTVDPNGPTVSAITLDSNSLRQAYTGIRELFVQWSAEKNLSLEELVELTCSFEPAKQSLIAWLSDTEVQRGELPVLDDLNFERFCIHNAINNMLKILVDKPKVVFVSGGEYMSQTLLSTLQRFFHPKRRIPLLLVVGINSHRALELRQDDEHWDHFLDWLDDHYSLHNLPELDNKLPALHSLDTSRSYTDAFNENLNMMAWPEAEAVARDTLKQQNLNDRDYCRLHLGLARVLLYRDEHEEALSQLKSIQETALTIENSEQHIEMLLLTCLCLVRLQQFDYALENAKYAGELAKNIKNERLMTQTMFVVLFVHDKCSTPIALNKYEELSASLEALGMTCSLLYCLRNCYSYMRFYPELGFERVLNDTNRSIRLARKINHLQAVAAGYHSKGIIYSYQENYRNTLRCFNISTGIRERINDDMDCVRMHNGTGYFYTLLEDYPNALEQYLGAFGRASRLSEYSEMLVTLYNLAWLHYCTHSYAKACEMVNAVLRICRIRKMSHFPFRNLFDVFSLKGLCHIQLNEISSAQQCLDKIDALLFEPSSTGEFMVAMLRGQLFKAYRDYPSAIACLEKAPLVLGDSVSMDSRLLPHLYIEHMSVLSEIGQWAQAETLLESCIAMTETMLLPHSHGMLSQVKALLKAQTAFRTRDLHAPKLRHVDLGLDALIESTKLAARLSSTTQRLREFKLISHIQAMSDRSRSPLDLARQTLRLLCANFTLQQANIFVYRHRQFESWVSYGQGHAIQYLMPHLNAFLRSPKGLAVNQIAVKGRAGLRERYDSVICLPLFNTSDGFYLLCLSNFKGNRYFDRQDEEILALLSNQLGSQLHQLKHSEQLRLMSLTDSLTGLANRSAMHASMRQVYECCSVAYIDLDNFKAINDKLGHDVGDKLLKVFAELLKQSLRQHDVAARWGGDEFVVLFPNTALAQAELVAGRIFQQLKDNDFFKEDLLRWGGGKELPKHFGCSIGLAQFEDDDGDLHHSLKRADNALYQAKHLGKGKICVARSHSIDHVDVK